MLSQVDGGQRPHPEGFGIKTFHLSKNKRLYFHPLIDDFMVCWYFKDEDLASVEKNLAEDYDTGTHVDHLIYHKIDAEKDDMTALLGKILQDAEAIRQDTQRHGLVKPINKKADVFLVYNSSGILSSDDPVFLKLLDGVMKVKDRARVNFFFFTKKASSEVIRRAGCVAILHRDFAYRAKETVFPDYKEVDLYFVPEEDKVVGVSFEKDTKTYGKIVKRHVSEYRRDYARRQREFKMKRREKYINFLERFHAEINEENR